MTRARDMANIAAGSFSIPLGALGNVPDGTASGTIVPWGGTTAPTGWLDCDGDAVSRTTYADLFTAIGTTYGLGDGSSTFNLPDLRGRVVAGKDNMGGTNANRLTNQTGGIDGNTLGNTGGSETHTLTEGQMPTHKHNARPAIGWGGGSLGSGWGRIDSNSPANPWGGIEDNKGNDEAHNNVQPTIILNYIIKT